MLYYRSRYDILNAREVNAYVHHTAKENGYYQHFRDFEKIFGYGSSAYPS